MKKKKSEEIPREPTVEEFRLLPTEKKGDLLFPRFPITDEMRNRTEFDDPLHAELAKEIRRRDNLFLHHDNIFSFMQRWRWEHDYLYNVGGEEWWEKLVHDREHNPKLYKAVGFSPFMSDWIYFLVERFAVQGEYDMADRFSLLGHNIGLGSARDIGKSLYIKGYSPVMYEVKEGTHFSEGVLLSLKEVPPPAGKTVMIIENHEMQKRWCPECYEDEDEEW